MGDAGAAGWRTSGATESFWTGTSPPLGTQALAADATADVAVVGAGIAGLSVAAFLAREGRRVVVLEDGLVGSGETGRTTAHFTAALDDRYHVLERKHGRKAARQAAASHTAAIDAVADLVRSERLPCDFARVDGYLVPHPSDEPNAIAREFEAARRAGLEVQVVDAAPGWSPASPEAGGGALRFPDQAQLHPLRYLRGLVRVVESAGGAVHTGTHVDKVRRHEVQATPSPRGVPMSQGNERRRFTVQAKHVVVATNAPISSRVALPAKQAAYRTYVIAGPIPSGSLPKALWWDTGRQGGEFPPYHYIRTAPAGERTVLLVGGEDHKVGHEPNTPDPYATLLDWARTRFPALREASWQWSGEVLEPFDHLAFLGKATAPRGTYVATGDSGNGMTHGTLAGLVIRDLVLAGRSPWAKLYSPRRKPMTALKAFAKESLDVTKHYADALDASDLERLRALPAGQGAVVRGAHPLAVYRGKDGAISACSAVCPHLGCIVRWNDLESSFDCPCHGSRFASHGEVLQGPANRPLAPRSDVEALLADPADLPAASPRRPSRLR